MDQRMNYSRDKAIQKMRTGGWGLAGEVELLREYVLLDCLIRAVFRDDLSKVFQIGIVVAAGGTRVGMKQGTRRQQCTDFSSPRCCLKFSAVISAGDLYAFRCVFLSFSYAASIISALPPKDHKASKRWAVWLRYISQSMHNDIMNRPLMKAPIVEKHMPLHVVVLQRLHQRCR
jgi:hypothetical protein